MVFSSCNYHLSVGSILWVHIICGDSSLPVCDSFEFICSQNFRKCCDAAKLSSKFFRWIFHSSHWPSVSALFKVFQGPIFGQLGLYSMFDINSAFLSLQLPSYYVQAYYANASLQVSSVVLHDGKS